jgi:predicted kinase
MLAARQLMLGQSVILDGMVGSGQVRQRWRQLAEEHSARLTVIECVCSDPQLHRARVDARQERIPGWPDPDWAHVQEMRQRYEAWGGERLIVDAAKPYAQNLRDVERYIAHERRSHRRRAPSGVGPDGEA